VKFDISGNSGQCRPGVESCTSSSVPLESLKRPMVTTRAQVAAAVHVLLWLRCPYCTRSDENSTARRDCRTKIQRTDRSPPKKTALKRDCPVSRDNLSLESLCPVPSWRLEGSVGSRPITGNSKCYKGDILYSYWLSEVGHL